MVKELKRILIVDDEMPILMLLSELLAGDGNEVITSGNMKDAEEACSRYKFDLVITDLRLSERNSNEGFELISHIKSLEPDTKVMLMTGNGNAEGREEAIRRGAVCCFEKPFDISVLAGKIQSFGISLPLLQKNSF